MKTIQRKIITVSSLYAIAVIANIVAMGLLGRRCSSRIHEVVEHDLMNPA